MPPLPKTIVLLAANIFKYYLEKLLGEDALSLIGNQLIDFAGEGLVEKLATFFDQGQRAEELLEAFKSADECFLARVDDYSIKQAIISKPLSNLPYLVNVASNIPNTLDDDGLVGAISNQLIKDWGEQLTEGERIYAAKVYRDCLDRELSIKCNQLLETLYRKVERIEHTADSVKKDTLELLEDVKSLQPTLDKLIDKNSQQTSIAFSVNNLPVSDSIPLQPNLFLQKVNLIDGLLKELSSSPWLALVDSAGKGKTQLATSVSTRFNGKFKWVSLANKGNTALFHLREQLALWIVHLSGDLNHWYEFLNGLSMVQIANIISANTHDGGILIIDDLPDPIYYEDLYNEIELFARSFINHGFRLLTTGQRELPINIRNNFASELSVKSCPLFDSEDILELISLSGAPESFRNSGNY